MNGQTQQTPIDRFYEKGLEFMARATSDARQRNPKATVTFPTIKPGTTEWDQWETYFLRTCGSLPAAMRDVERGMVGSFTVPTKLPEWFDASYLPPDYVPVRESRWKTVPSHMRVESFERVMARINREPMPPRPSTMPAAGTVVPWDEVPNGTRLVGRFDRTWNGAVKNPVVARGQRQAPKSLEASAALVATLGRQTREAAE